MTLQVLTPIFPPHIKPVRDGWYLIAGGSGWRLAQWNGGWCTGENVAHWRGLAFCPYTAIATTHTDVCIASQRVFEVEGVFLPGAVCS
jgi:hypothetical protein